MGPETVNGVVATEAQGQGAVQHRFAVAVVNQEERRSIASGSDQYHRVRAGGPGDKARELLDRRGFDQ